MIVHAGNSSIWKAEAGGSEVQGHPQLQSELINQLGVHEKLSQSVNQLKKTLKIKVIKMLTFKMIQCLGVAL